MNEPSTSRRSRIAAVLTAAALLLGGCSSEDATTPPTGSSGTASGPAASAQPTAAVTAAPTEPSAQAAAPSSSESPAAAPDGSTTTPPAPTPTPAASPTESADLSTTPAPTVSTAPDPTETSDACATGDLRVQVRSTGGAAGSTTYAVRFTNSSDRDCTLSGYPEVSFADESGAVLGAPATPASEQTGEATRLGPGQSAEATLRSTQPELYGEQCSRTSAAGLRVSAPGSRESLDVSLSLPACADPQVQQLSIGPIDARG